MRPRRLWYAIAAVLALLLAGGGVTVIVMTVTHTVTAVDADRSFPSGGSRTFSFTAEETKAIYVSQSGEGRVRCEIPRMPAGSLTKPDSSFRLTVGSRTWERVFEVKPGSGGEYTLTCAAEGQAEFALGDRPRVGVMVGAIFGAIGLFFAALATAVIISAVTAVRRGRHRRQLAGMTPPRPPQWSRPPFGSPPVPPTGPPS